MSRVVVAAVLVLCGGRAYADTCDGPSGLDVVAGVLEALASSGNGTSSPTTGTGVAQTACVDANGQMIECPEQSRESSRPIAIELGTAVRSFTSALGTTNGTIDHDGEAFTYRATGARAEDLAGVVQLRITTSFRDHVYVGGEIEGGVFTGGTGTVEMTSGGTRGEPSIAPASVATTYGGVAIAGVAGDIGRLTLGAEAAGGGRAVTYSFNSHYGACETSDTVTVGMPVLEARARMSLWVQPNVRLGGTYGRSVIDNAWLGGVYLGWASR